MTKFDQLPGPARWNRGAGVRGPRNTGDGGHRRVHSSRSTGSQIYRVPDPGNGASNSGNLSTRSRGTPGPGEVERGQQQRRRPRHQLRGSRDRDRGRDYERERERERVPAPDAGGGLRAWAAASAAAALRKTHPAVAEAAVVSGRGRGPLVIDQHELGEELKRLKTRMSSCANNRAARQVSELAGARGRRAPPEPGVASRLGRRRRAAGAGVGELAGVGANLECAI
ncbi:MAG: hypothetical protein M1826_004240 [Phylliscum demangeonii]|nr:MAG: hypothetical protein M1826_004240 [Phylliscum demangeonii]